MLQKNDIKQELLDKAYNALEKSNFSAMLILPTGSGKSSLLIRALKKLKPKRCVYLADSTLNRDKTFKEELIKQGAEEWVDKIEYMCYQTMCRKKGEKYDLVLGDEGDFAMTKKYSKAFTNNTFKYKIIVSATLAEDKRALAKKIAPIVFEAGLSDIEGKGIVNTTNYYVVNYMLSDKENFAYLKYNTMFAHLMNAKPLNHFRLQSLQLTRKRFLNNLNSSLRVCRALLKELYENPKNKILIFCGLTEQADRVCKYSYHTQNGNIAAFEAFDNGDIRAISVVDKVSRGLNINGVNNIIFESPENSETKHQQKSGRGRRLKADDELSIYFLVPYFKDRNGTVRATIVEKWIYNSTGKMNIKPIIHNLKYKADE